MVVGDGEGVVGSIAEFGVRPTRDKQEAIGTRGAGPSRVRGELGVEEGGEDGRVK